MQKNNKKYKSAKKEGGGCSDGEALQRKGNELSIINGLFETEITGGEFAGDGNILEMEVNGIIDSKTFDVKPHQLSITTSANHYLTETDTVTIQVLDDLGSPGEFGGHNT